MITIDPVPKQLITSFGASGAWWPNDLVHFPSSVQARLAHLLFSEDGLSLTSYRYNLGGDGGHDEQQVVTNGSRVESFLLRNGTYDWSRDHAGVSFLKQAQKYNVPYITFFVNAAPSHIADNGAACGWNLTVAKSKPFALYVKTVLAYWKAHGINNLRYVSPMNEPDNNRANCGQEGMAVPPAIRPVVFKDIREALDASSMGKAIDIMGDETSQITTQAYPEYPDWLPESSPYLSSIAVHNYDYPNDSAIAAYRQEILSLTDRHRPPIKFTETCCSTRSGSGSSVFGAQYDPTMANALIVARYVWQFLTIAQAESFDWWTAVTNLPCSPKISGSQCATTINETAGYNSGLVYIDGNYNQTHDYNLYLTKRAWMLKHFAYFHRPGSKRLDVPQKQLPEAVNAFASRSEDGKTYSVLFMNNQTSPYELELQTLGKSARVIQVVQTTEKDDWQQVKPLPNVDRRKMTVRYELPAKSLVTLKFGSAGGYGLGY